MRVTNTVPPEESINEEKFWKIHITPGLFDKDRKVKKLLTNTFSLSRNNEEVTGLLL